MRTQERRRGEQPRLGRRSDAVARFDLFYLRSRDRVSSPAGPLFCKELSSFSSFSSFLL